MSQYDVGTVLWIIHKERPGLVAYRVIEEITKKTLEGEKIQYLVQPASPKARTVQLESIKGRIFLNSEEAKNAFDIACKNEDRFQGAIIGVKDAQAQLLSTKAQEEELKPSDAQKSS